MTKLDQFMLFLIIIICLGSGLKQCGFHCETQNLGCGEEYCLTPFFFFPPLFLSKIYLFASFLLYLIIRNNIGKCKFFGIKYKKMDLLTLYEVNYNAIEKHWYWTITWTTPLLKCICKLEIMLIKIILHFLRIKVK